MEVPSLTRTFTAMVTRGGKVTIPKSLREILHIEPGDTVTMFMLSHIRANGRVIDLSNYPKASRTFSKTVLHGYKVALPYPLKRLFKIDEGDYLTLVLLHVERGGMQ